SGECQANTLSIIRTAQAFIDERGAQEPFGKVVVAPRPSRAAALAPLLRGLASTDRPMIGHFTDDPVVLDFLAREKLYSLAALGPSCPDHFLRTKVRPLVLDPGAPSEERTRDLHAAYRADYAAYYQRHATPESPPMRGADPAIILVPGV